MTIAQTSSAQREPSMEEILASIRRIIEDSDTAERDEQETARPEDEESPAAQVEAFRAGLAEAPAQGPRPTAAEAPRSLMDAPAPRPEPVHGAEVRTIRPAEVARPAAAGTRGSEAPAQHTVQPERPPQAEAELPSILSEEAGRQVAAAFGELSDVLAASRRRSFDDIALELMRPMLQDWLDNNLPTLVERLVREEIERVARGG